MNMSTLKCVSRLTFELQDLITILQFQLPLKEEINHELTRLVNSLNIDLEPELFETLTRTCQGLSIERIRRVLSKIIATHKTIDENSIGILLSEKKQIISQTEILEYCSGASPIPVSSTLNISCSFSVSSTTILTKPFSVNFIALPTKLI